MGSWLLEEIKKNLLSVKGASNPPFLLKGGLII
jgi:hypothetical protein